jgi:DNA polymerase-3 subunit beta
LVRGKVDEEGEITVPAKLFYDYISLLKEEKIDIFSDDNVLKIEAGENKTKINGLSSSEFPLVPSVSIEKTFFVPINNFQTALSQTVFAASNNESRPELSGLLLRFKENKLIMAATDSYRLTEKIVNLPVAVNNETSVIIPARTIIEAHRIFSIFKDLPDSPSEIQISLSENQIVFTFGSVELISRVIEGNFPDYQQIIPKNFQTEARISREDLINAIKTASLFSRSGLFDVLLSFDPNGVIKASSADATRGENTAFTKAEVSGAENFVTLNFRYLLDGLQSITDETVLFQMIDGSNPCVIKPSSQEGQLYIIMPIRQ